LSRLLASYGFDVVHNIPLIATQVAALDASRFDVMLVDRPETGTPLAPHLAGILAKWQGPLLYNDSTATESSLHRANPDFGRVLSRQLTSLADSIHTCNTRIKL